MADKILNPLPLLEVEEDDDRDIPEETNFDYSCQEVLDSIGKEEFKTIWSLMIGTIQKALLSSQVLFCKSILDKFEDVYKFGFLSPRLEVLEDVQRVYSFLTFVEYDHHDFLVELFSKLQVLPNKVLDFRVLLSSLWSKVSEFLDQFWSTNEMVTEFFRTYIKEDCIDYLSKISEREKTEVTISLILRGEKDGKTEENKD